MLYKYLASGDIHTAIQDTWSTAVEDSGTRLQCRRDCRRKRRAVTVIDIAMYVDRLFSLRRDSSSKLLLCQYRELKANEN